jgi:hypothetical protein
MRLSSIPPTVLIAPRARSISGQKRKLRPPTLQTGVISVVSVVVGEVGLVGDVGEVAAALVLVRVIVS